jgi:hypothetical protein
LAAAGGAIPAGETLLPVQIAGLALALLAIASFAFESRRVAALLLNPFAYGIVTALFIGSNTVRDALGVRAAGSPLGFIARLRARSMVLDSASCPG